MQEPIDLAIELEANQYHEGFKEFLARTDQKKITLEWFESKFRYQTHIRRVLSIGCGEGPFDLSLLKILPNVQTYVGIEPNPSHISAFRHHIENEPLPFQPNMRFIQARFEEVDLSSEFDLILISQSLYYPKDKQATIEKAFELLDVSGEMVIFHTMGNCGIDQLKQEFDSHTYRYMGETLLTDLQRTQLPYKAEVLPSTIYVQELPLPLLEFMLERTVTAEEHRRAEAYLRRNCPAGYLEHPLLAVHIQAGLSTDSYRNDYQIFRELTDTMPVVQLWAHNLLASLDFPVQKILSIGCGNGYLDESCFLSQLDTVHSYTGLDPSPEHLQECRQRLAVYDNLETELHLEHFQDFRTDDRYDLIIMSHMLYYVPERKFALSKACTLLKENGVLVILHQTERGINVIQKRYGRTRHAYNALELSQDLDVLDIPYYYNELDSYVNLDQISDPLIRFFLEGAVTQWQIEDVRRYLLRQYPEKRMHHPIGTFYISARDFRDTIQPRLLSDAQYAECFAEFLTRSNQHHKIIEWFGEQTLIERNIVHNMLSIGCGTGSFDLELVQSLPNLQRLVLVEPNSNHVAALKKNVTTTTTSFNTYIEASSLADYHPDGRFDLIILAHSMYYMADIKEVVAQAVSMLSEEGKLLILHEPPYGGMHRLMKKVGVFGRISLTTEHIEAYLCELGLDFQVDTVPITVDLRKISDRILHFLLEREPTTLEIVEARDHLGNMVSNGFLTQDTRAIVVHR